MERRLDPRLDRYMHSKSFGPAFALAGRVHSSLPHIDDDTATSNQQSFLHRKTAENHTEMKEETDGHGKMNQNAEYGKRKTI